MVRALIFLSIILLYGLLNYWIGMRLWQLAGKFIPHVTASLYWLVFWLVVLSFLAGRLCERYVNYKIGQPLILLGSYWMAAMVYLAIILGLLELVRLADKRLTFLPRGAYEQFPTAPLIGFSVLIIVIVIIGYGWWNARIPHIIHYDINIPKQAGSIKQLHVVAVSDLHLGNTVHNKRLQGLVEMVNGLNPDIILLPGDIVDEDPMPFIEQNMGHTLRKLAPRYGIYAVPGNHEYIGGRWVEIINGLEKAGVNVLQDEVIKVADSFYVVGRDDLYSRYYTNNKRSDLQTIVQGIDKALPVIAIDHQPVNLSEPEEQGVDLQISGHTHRGQFFPFNIVTARIFEIDRGYLRKENLQVIVSTGFGTWGPPVRIGSQSEILDIVINFNSPAGKSPS
ncbi:metallophosphoesterase [Desulfoscipio gibsoniae]|uniref:Putative phosphohydrolase n=1 Tax=Desulfoscipio gibsoniae DSM 7213 TaxID=767817 RepID=R4KS07_9FIRM|nr:metallophosphoesterase [Desulfoscipio gibsoniae]AGL03370.1 putative phosphohydrolase [Desulfoscipio gibsoniae DSM 7213]